MEYEFEWDEGKNSINKNKHRIDFADASRVFYDENRVSKLDSRENYGEDRYQVIGMSYGTVLIVVYTERHGNTIRIISARRVTKQEENAYRRGMWY